MSVPVETDGPGWKLIAGVTGLLLTSLFAWIANLLRSEQKDLGTQLAGIRRDYVSRDELDKRIDALRADTLRLHGENQRHLERIEKKLDQGSQTRHDIRDGINATELMVRDILKKLQGNAP